MIENKVSDILNSLGKSSIMVLATCHENIVSARAISCILYNNLLFFQTSKHSNKYKQIKKNNQVAVCKDNVQIQGIAQDFGSTKEKLNMWFTDIYRRYYEESYKRYTNLDDEVIIRIVPTVISIWDYDDFGPYQKILNLDDNECKYIRCKSL